MFHSDSRGKQRFDFSIDAILGRSDKSQRGIVQHSDKLVNDDSNYMCSLVIRGESHECTPSFDNEINYNNYSCSTSPPSQPLEFHSESRPLRNERRESTFSWLNCTRFKPPKLPRSKKKCATRRHGRGPRIPFSSQQLTILERTFTSSHYLSSGAIIKLAQSLQLTEIRVKIWFQNRRARLRREQDIPPTSAVTSPSAPETCRKDVFKREQRLRTKQESMDPKASFLNLISSPSSFFVNGGHSEIFSNKRGFRHLVNDLNLLAAANCQQHMTALGDDPKFARLV